jgi:hypothetical protein
MLMSKSKNFSGQPVFSQLFSFLPKDKIKQLIDECQSDRYFKKFKTWDHLITMLFAVFTKCQGLRELESGMAGFSNRFSNLGLTHIAPRSTLSDANINRRSEVFEAIFKACYNHLRPYLPDSCLKNHTWLEKLFLIDSTTITLFKEILKAAGRTPANGKRKGGVKIHVGMYLKEDVPSVVRISSSATHDSTFLKQFGSLIRGTILVFDKAYVNFNLFNQWTKDGIVWVTRKKEWLVENVLEEHTVSQQEQKEGVFRIQTVELGHSNQKEKVKCRLIYLYDQDKNRVFKFITNDFKYKTSEIAEMYKQRWQIELLFKRLKQNLLLGDFLGDNENAIRIQIWCNLIADLLIAVAQKMAKRKWAYSNVAGIIRLHLMNYVDLFKLLKNPNRKEIFIQVLPTPQLYLPMKL